MRVLHVFIGKMGSGKTFKANKLAQELRANGNDVYLTALAEPIKTMCKKVGLVKEITDANFLDIKEAIEKYNFSMHDILFSWAKEQGYSERDYLYYVQPVINIIDQDLVEIHSLVSERFKMTTKTIISKVKVHMRRIMQLIGTDFGRNMLHRDVWIEYFQDKMKRILSNVENDIDVILDDVRFVNEIEFLITGAFVNSTFGKVHIYYVTASNEDRAVRLGYTLEQLNDLDTHDSEQEVEKCATVAVNFYNQGRVDFSMVYNPNIVKAEPRAHKGNFLKRFFKH